eukprot:2265553-Pleurochrysis_carterae.AAC.2
MQTRTHSLKAAKLIGQRLRSLQQLKRQVKRERHFNACSFTKERREKKACFEPLTGSVFPQTGMPPS